VIAPRIEATEVPLRDVLPMQSLGDAHVEARNRELALL
jgi:hypothetical protein